MPGGSDNGKWLECNGQPVNATSYPKLAVLMSNVPNYQGMFLRGYGAQEYSQLNGSKNGMTITHHSSGSLNQVQGDAIRNIYGKIGLANNSFFGGTTAGVFSYKLIGSVIGPVGGLNNGLFEMTFDTETEVPVSTENRPINMAVRYLIKAK